MRSIQMASGMLTFNPDKIHKTFSVGDFVQFYPQIIIDYYNLSIQEGPYLQHIIYDIYKFSFLPIAKYFNNEYKSIYKNCYHYLIEIFPDFKLFCFNWTKPYQSYLKVGQWYEGYGQLSNCGNAAEYNEYISSLMMDRILKTGKLTGIYENLFGRDFKKIKPFRYENICCYEDIHDSLGYFKNLDAFNINVSKYKDQSIRYNCIDVLLPAYSNVIFCVDILDK